MKYESVMKLKYLIEIFLWASRPSRIVLLVSIYQYLFIQ